jgi:hypothetical protein
MLRDPVNVVWAIYLLLVPVYVFASGLPQPGDWIILLFAPMVLARWDGRLSNNQRRPLRYLLVFTLYVAVENLIWSAALGAWTLSTTKGFTLATLFYIYNGVMFLSVLVLFRRYGEAFLRFTAKAVLFALLVQTALGFVKGGHSLRATAMFNNPNQLGYYALLSISLLMLFQRRLYVSTLEVSIGAVASAYLTLISASKAALGAVGILIIVGMVVRLRTMLIIASVFGLSLVIGNPMRDAIDRSMYRIETDESLGFWEERGYDRIWNNPEYVVYGAGEGGYVRFRDSTAIGAHEIHSSVGTLFFCYGIVGAILFGAFVVVALRGSELRVWLLVMPPFAYGMTHQGLRSTLLWVLLAVVVAMRELPRIPARAR